jgi:hypothetical protein
MTVRMAVALLKFENQMFISSQRRQEPPVLGVTTFVVLGTVRSPDR